MNLLRVWLIVLRAESLRLLRTREIYTYLLLPALLAVPVGLAGAALARTLTEAAPRVAVGADVPPELEIAAELESRKILAISVADPEAALAAGEVDAALVRWVAGDGVGAALGPGPVRWRWRADLLGGDVTLQDELRAAVEDAGDQALDGWVRIAGGDPARDLWVAEVRALPVKQVDLEGRIGRFLVAYSVFVLGLVGVMTVVGFTAAERAEGVLESLTCTAAPAWIWLVVRVLLVTALQGLAATALLSSVSLVALSAEVVLPWPSWFALRLVVALFTTNMLFLLLGVVAPSVRLALGAGSYVLLAAGLVLGWGVFDAPVAVPLAGLVAATDLPELALAVGSALSLSGLILVATVFAQRMAMSRGSG